MTAQTGRGVQRILIMSGQIPVAGRAENSQNQGVEKICFTGTIANELKEDLKPANEINKKHDYPLSK